MRKRLLKAQFGAVLSGDKPPRFPSLALPAAKGQLSSASAAGIPPAPGALQPPPCSQNIPAAGKSQQHLQDASASWALPQPRSVSWGHVLPCTCWELDLREAHGDVCGICRVTLFPSQISVPGGNASSHVEHPTKTPQTCFLSPAREVFLCFLGGSERVPVWRGVSTCVCVMC